MIRIAPPTCLVLGFLFAALLAVPRLPALTLVEDADGYFGFTPQGDALLASTRQVRDLVLHEFAPGTTRRLELGLPESEQVNGPFFAATPDGSRILVSSFPVQGSYDPEFQHLYLVNRDGTGAIRAVTGFQDVTALFAGNGTVADDCVVFRRRNPAGAEELLAYHYADGALVRLSRPDHEAARISFMLRSRTTGEVVYVGDDERPGHFRLFRVDPRGETRVELSAGLPRDFVVHGELPGRSDRDHDKDGVKLLETTEGVLFTAQDPATGFGHFDPRHLFVVPLGGGPVTEVFRGERGEGTFEFWPIPERDAVVIRAHTPESHHFVAELATSTLRPLHPPATGWQGSYQALPSPRHGRVYWFGDLESPNVRGYLYSAAFDGSDFRRHRFTIPYDEKGSLFPELDDQQGALFFRGGQKGPSGFELYAVRLADGSQEMLSSRTDREEVQWFAPVPGRSAVVWSQPRSLWFRDLASAQAVRLAGQLPSGTDVLSFKVSPTGAGVAWVKRVQGGPITLEYQALPAHPGT